MKKCPVVLIQESMVQDKEYVRLEWNFIETVLSKLENSLDIPAGRKELMLELGFKRSTFNYYKEIYERTN